MTALPWFKCYPRDFREGLTGLTCDERGAYTTILMLIYERGAPVPDDDAWIAANLWCSVRTWKKMRASLIVKRRLFALNINGEDCLMDERAAEEIAKTADLCTLRKTAGKEGGKRSAAKRTPVSNENNELDQASASGLVNQTPSKNQPDIQTIRIDSVVPSNEGPTGGEPPNDPNAKAWAEARTLLVGQGRMTLETGGKFFGKLLSTHGLEARDLLGAVNEAFANRTPDPQAYLTKAAQARSRRREATGPAKRVGFV